MTMTTPLPPGSRLPDALFFACGVAIGGAGGVVQAASRTMMVRHTSAERAAGAFGLYALSGKATAFLAPALIAVVTTLLTHSLANIAEIGIAIAIGGAIGYIVAQRKPRAMMHRPRQFVRQRRYPCARSLRVQHR